MKKSTKLLILSAIFGLVFTLTACNFSANNTDKNKKKTTTTNTPTNAPSGITPDNPDIELEAIDMPLTLQIITDGKIILSGRNSFEKVQFQKNDDLLIDAADNISVQAGDIIRFYASNYKYKDTGTINLTIDSTAECYVYGNIMSLIYYTDFAGKTELTDNYVLQKLFQNNTHIKNHDSLELVLPATTLSESCYKMMFYGCTGITRAPELIAETLTDDCYNQMFCNCTNLKTIKCMATNIFAQGCTANWITNVSATGNFTSIQENSIWRLKDKYSGIPREWTANPPLVIPDARELPLTLEAEEAGTIYLTNYENYNNVVYSKNDGERIDYTASITVNAGDKVSFFADGPKVEQSVTSYMNINCTKACYVYGNVMSLLYPDDFSSKTQILMNASFRRLFFNNTSNSNIKNCSIELVLPATELKPECYEEMFYGCSNLTIAPELPALTLASNCYNCMFQSCTALMTPPELPATTLAEKCYTCMFKDCSNLITAPALPATTMTAHCYKEMFKNCTNIKTAPELPAQSLADYCYTSMFSGCSNLITAPALPAATLAQFCYQSMFYGCSYLAAPPTLSAETLALNCCSSMFSGCRTLMTAPELSAEILKEACYESMFKDCTSLIKAPVLPATTLEKECYSGMFSGCTSLSAAPELPATNLSSSWTGCYTNMFKNCSKLGYVVCRVEKFNGSEITDTTNLQSYFNFWLSGVSHFGLLLTPTPSKFTNSIAPSEDTVNPSANWIIAKNHPLTIEAIEDGTVTIKYSNKFNNFYSYKNYELYIPGSNDNSTDINIAVTPGDKICIFAEGLGREPYSLPQPEHLSINCNSDCYIYGNIMSLVAPNNYDDKTDLDKKWYFYSLFYNDTVYNKIQNHPKELLLLTATQLSKACYQKMFYNCRNLSKAPQLPATNLADSCYLEMFDHCKNLTKAPDLPATTLAESCYEKMFNECDNLSTAPERLPAPELKTKCYSKMFSYCTSLKTAPVLPANTLVMGCYSEMFQMCSSLNYIKCMATPDNPSLCLRNWIQGVGREGTFVKRTSTNWQTTGYSGIPNGWKQETASQ